MKKIVMPVVAFGVMTACNETLIERPVMESEYGYISLGLVSDVEIVDTKSQQETYSTYNVTLKQGENTIWTKEYGSLNANNLKITRGTYSMYVENFTADESESIPDAYGSVRVAGEDNDIPVIPGETTPVEIKCTPINAKVTVEFADGFTDVFNEPSVTLVDGERELQMTNVGGNPTAAYFNVDGNPLSWRVNASVNGTQKQFSGPFTVQQNKWTKISFSAGTSGTITIQISVDETIKDVITVPVEVDPTNSDQPSVEE